MKLASIIVLIGSSVALPLSAQLRVETGGGQGQLDRLAPSSLTAVGGALNARVGPSLLAIAGDAEDRFGLGSTGSASASWLYHVGYADWNISAGPEAEFAHDIAAPWAHTVSAHVTLTHSARAVRPDWRLGSRARRRPGFTPTPGIVPTFDVGFHAGEFSIGAAWHSTVTVDTADTYSDSLPRTSNSRSIHDLSARAAWAVGPLVLSAQLGRRSGLRLAVGDLVGKPGGAPAEPGNFAHRAHRPSRVG